MDSQAPEYKPRPAALIDPGSQIRFPVCCRLFKPHVLGFPPTAKLVEGRPQADLGLVVEIMPRVKSLFITCMPSRDKAGSGRPGHRAQKASFSAATL